jgi:molybdenum cofactor cytidylyltransferase
MQRCKQLLPWRDTTLLGNSINIANSIKTNRIVAVLGANADAIANETHLADIDHIVNPAWESGLGSSLALGANFLLKRGTNYDGILVMLCDQPLIDTEYLNILISRFKNNEKNIIATDYGKGAGVPAIFGPEYFSALVGLNGDVGAKNLLARYKSDVLRVDPQGKAIDVDTLEDYQKLVEQQQGFGT